MPIEKEIIDDDAFREIPSLAIKSISSHGVMEIEFNMKMKSVNLTYLNETSLELTPITENEG